MQFIIITTCMYFDSIMSTTRPYKIVSTFIATSNYNMPRHLVLPEGLEEIKTRKFKFRLAGESDYDIRYLLVVLHYKTYLYSFPCYCSFISFTTYYIIITMTSATFLLLCLSTRYWLPVIDFLTDGLVSKYTYFINIPVYPGPTGY